MTEATSLQGDLRLYGDDINELMESYASRFSVDMSSYLWYFHTGEEGLNIPGGLFFPPPNQRVTEIPITVGLLLDCANAGKWNVEYREHSIPERRYDVVVNLGLVALFVLFLLYRGVLWLAE